MSYTYTIATELIVSSDRLLVLHRTRILSMKQFNELTDTRPTAPWPFLHRVTTVKLAIDELVSPTLTTASSPEVLLDGWQIALVETAKDFKNVKLLSTGNKSTIRVFQLPPEAWYFGELIPMRTELVSITRKINSLFPMTKRSVESFGVRKDVCDIVLSDRDPADFPEFICLSTGHIEEIISAHISTYDINLDMEFVSKTR